MPKKTVTPALTLTLTQALGAWVRHQGLAEPAGSAESALERFGWIRTLGGVDGYLSLHARIAGLRVNDVHEGVSARRLVVVPSLRGCIYLAPAAHAGLALALARDLVLPREEKTWAKAELSVDELTAAGDAILSVLAEGPQTTTALRSLLPPEHTRKTGPVGKKAGVSSLLPPALRRLEFDGRIVRQPVDDRLDHERYAWRVAPAEALDTRPVALRQAEVVRLVLRWMAPFTVSDIAGFTGMRKGDTKKALAAIEAVPVAVTGRDDLHYVNADQVDSLTQAAPPRTSLLPSLDTLLSWHGSPALFIDPRDRERMIPVWGRSKPTTWSQVKHSMARVVLTGAVVRGRWEVDPDALSVVTGPYAPGLPDDLAAVVAGVEAQLRDIGHGRNVSLTKDDDLRRRAAQVRALG